MEPSLLCQSDRYLILRPRYAFTLHVSVPTGVVLAGVDDAAVQAAALALTNHRCQTESWWFTKLYHRVTEREGGRADGDDYCSEANMLFISSVGNKVIARLCELCASVVNNRGSINFN